MRTLADAGWGVWLSAHLALYLALDLGTLAVLAAAAPGGGRSIVGDVLASAVWTMPLHLAALMLAAGQLVLLRLLATLTPWRFRLAALVVFALPPVAWLLLVTRGDTAVLVDVLPMHVLMGLLVVRPRRRDATADPSMAEHDRWYAGR
ncbi:MAG TPA: hypothetical protein VES42_20645 [Pilimelia sp.]|nr:hypothetical protein [Pilimelia sp.]